MLNILLIRDDNDKELCVVEKSDNIVDGVRETNIYINLSNILNEMELTKLGQRYTDPQLSHKISYDKFDVPSNEDSSDSSDEETEEIPAVVNKRRRYFSDYADSQDESDEDSGISERRRKLVRRNISYSDNLNIVSSSEDNQRRTDDELDEAIEASDREDPDRDHSNQEDTDDDHQRTTEVIEDVVPVVDSIADESRIDEEEILDSIMNLIDNEEDNEPSDISDSEDTQEEDEADEDPRHQIIVIDEAAAIDAELMESIMSLFNESSDNTVNNSHQEHLRRIIRYSASFVDNNTYQDETEEDSDSSDGYESDDSGREE
ncbi:unnamed protein product [Diamesa hyperborea]